jgi:hypothetical protein
MQLGRRPVRPTAGRGSSNGLTDNKPGSSTDRAVVDAALAEYNALRTELVAHSAAENAVVGLGLTGIGVVAGVAFGGSGNRHLLAIAPLVASVIILAYCGEAYRVISIGRYIRDDLWPFIQHRTSTDLPSWENSLKAGRRKTLSGIVEVPIVGMLYAIGLACALLANGVPVEAKVAAITILTISAVLGFFFTRRR